MGVVDNILCYFGEKCVEGERNTMILEFFMEFLVWNYGIFSMMVHM